MKPKAKAWKAFSMFIRERDGHKCVQCMKTKEQGYIMQAGHVIPKVRGNSIYWREDNVFCQCKGCNNQHSLDNYAYNQWFIKRFGEEEYDRLRVLSNTTLRMYESDYVFLAELYKQKLKDLKGGN